MKLFTCYYKSPVGFVKIQCNDHNIVAIQFSTDTATNEVHPLLSSCQQQFDEYFSGERRIFNLPLEFSGTAFQKLVWEYLLNIPFGRTVSYLRLSEMMGNVKAIRAVAAANGKNNFAIVVPCHRVIGSDKSLVGYAGGIWRKTWLLQHELKIQAGVEQSLLFQ
jgi:methylated-DNA-[protein]-cysteine S-methyltransferase